MHNDPRYAPVEGAWQYVDIPPLTRADARWYARLLLKAFTKKQDCAVRGYRYPLSRTWWYADYTKRGRRCWVSRKPGYSLDRGWGRLVHDCSHVAFRFRHPNWRPHEHGHEELELEMVHYVVSQNWLALKTTANQFIDIAMPG